MKLVNNVYGLQKITFQVVRPKPSFLTAKLLRVCKCLQDAGKRCHHHFLHNWNSFRWHHKQGQKSVEAIRIHFLLDKRHQWDHSVCLRVVESMIPKYLVWSYSLVICLDQFQSSSLLCGYLCRFGSSCLGRPCWDLSTWLGCLFLSLLWQIADIDLLCVWTHLTDVKHA